jgi:hypothetical protein
LFTMRSRHTSCSVLSRTVLLSSPYIFLVRKLHVSSCPLCRAHRCADVPAAVSVALFPTEGVNRNQYLSSRMSCSSITVLHTGATKPATI